MPLDIGVYDQMPLHVLLGVAGEGALRTPVLLVLGVHDPQVLGQGRLALKRLTAVLAREILGVYMHGAVYE